MSTFEHCRAMAEEAERLAGIVSYGRDKIRLREQARSWREKAQALELAPPPEALPPDEAHGVRRWLRRLHA